MTTKKFQNHSQFLVLLKCSISNELYSDKYVLSPLIFKFGSQSAKIFQALCKFGPPHGCSHTPPQIFRQEPVLDHSGATGAGVQQKFSADFTVGGRLVGMLGFYSSNNLPSLNIVKHIIGRHPCL